MVIIQCWIWELLVGVWIITGTLMNNELCEHLLHTKQQIWMISLFPSQNVFYEGGWGVSLGGLGSYYLGSMHSVFIIKLSVLLWWWWCICLTKVWKIALRFENWNFSLNGDNEEENNMDAVNFGSEVTYIHVLLVLELSDISHF